MAFDGLFLHQLIKQLKIIESSRITKVYIISKYEMLLHLRCHKENKKLFISIHPSYARIQLTDLNYPTPEIPSSLTMLFRKHLEGSFIESIEQIELNRLIKINIKGYNELKDLVSYHLYIEIMGKYSNCVLTYQDNKVIDALKRVSPSDSSRIIQPGISYTYPELIKKHNPFKTSQYLENFVSHYEGFSKDLAHEMEYRLSKGESFDSVMHLINESSSIYITSFNQKDYYHVIPFLHLNQEYETYPINEGLDIYYKDLDQKDRIKQQSANLLRYLKNEYAKNVSKLHKLEATLHQSENSDIYRIKGDLLYASLHLIKKGMKQVTVDNYYDDSQMTIDLDERFDGKTNANKYYNKYQKAKNSLKVLQTQIDKTKEEIDYFDSLLTQMEYANYYDAMEIKEELENLHYLSKKKVKGKIRKKNKPHFLTMTTHSNRVIYVGKNNLQNDYITFHHASKNDIWFHVKDMPGSHVIVKGNELDEETIRLAAKIAAYYSKGRLSSSVPVNYTEVKTLKKPTGYKPGMVLLNHYKTIYIDPDDSFLKEVTIE